MGTALANFFFDHRSWLIDAQLARPASQKTRAPIDNDRQCQGHRLHVVMNSGRVCDRCQGHTSVNLRDNLQGYDECLARQRPGTRDVAEFASLHTFATCAYTLDYTESSAQSFGVNISVRYGWPGLCLSRCHE